MEQGIKNWIEHRRKVADAIRKPGTLDELAKRRGRMNPRLSHDWLRYLVTVGGRQDPDGWRWKIDPAMRFGGFGPWRHTWAMAALPAVSVPLLGLLGLIPEDMGWGTQPGQLEPYLPSTAKMIYFEDTGHFVHIEKPREVADHVLDFLS
jgi:pimeloyl-ACP methyl ester carboxylesterase